jgi:hypothetical protein
MLCGSYLGGDVDIMVDLGLKQDEHSTAQYSTAPARIDAPFFSDDWICNGIDCDLHLASLLSRFPNKT